MTGITRQLADFAAGLTFDKVPADVAARTKLLILDTAGIMVRARHDAESTPSLVRAAERLGQLVDAEKKTGCSVLGDGRGYTPSGAALINGAMAHSLDFDDTHAEASLHSSAPIVPAVLAAAEMVDASGKDVITACADRATTWISDEIEAVYGQLHRQGWVHSVETWREGRLVGGLYGVALGGAFMAESMFHRERDMGKVALAALIERLRERGFSLLDIQYETRATSVFQPDQIPRQDYLERLRAALPQKVSF